MIKYMSSAYLMRWLQSCMGWRFDAPTMCDAGPMTEPCTVLAFMMAASERAPANLVT